MTDIDELRLLTIDEVAEILRVEKTSLFRKIKTKEIDLPYIRFGKKVLFTLEDVKTFIERNRRGSDGDGQGESE